MNTITRRNDIVKRVKKEGSIDVEGLAVAYGVSVETVRRDLRYLDDKGLIKRTYGGAVKRERTTWDMPYNQRILFQKDLKEAIAREAVKQLENGDSIYIDGNTTCVILSRFIPPDLELSIVTNSLHIAWILKQHGGRMTIYLVGGELGQEGMTFGHKLIMEMKQYQFDKVFFSCMGINAKGCYYSKWEPMLTAQTAAEHANRVILLADSSKMNRNGFLFGLDHKSIDCLVTDEGAPEPLLDKLRESIEQVITVPVTENSNAANSDQGSWPLDSPILIKEE
ncbi:DeoR/GlpR family DNA-binding transcription regulator [Paenibacillus sepulcri]|uniref:Lactose phosphotransferase system repressor n=1 Tax=Paenibacillus sepulcri TaxID=359917 RepID=A0ABS7C395_9BACL|nr:DeoR family transcriptional regulator [Paenibacillus sepulcri]